MTASTFFSSKQKKLLHNAIQDSEDKTSGEIRLHIENHCETDLLERAKDVFYILQMNQTENRNGILIYIALSDKKAAIIGDEGIDKITPEDYWEKEVNLLLDHFKKAEFLTGLTIVINQIGEKLQLYFPIKENDINELSDEISFYDN